MFQDPGSGGLESKGDLKERGLVQDSRGDRALLRHQKAQKAKKKSFRSQLINRAPLSASDIMLFRSNLVSRREAAGDPESWS